MDTEKTGKKKIIAFLALFLAMIFFYFLLSNKGAFAIMGRLNEKDVGLPIIFVIGLLASFHCVGMCGSFVASYSAKKLCLGQKIEIKNHLLYNIGRFFSYTISGGLLGLFGSAFQINSYFSGVLVFIAGIMIVVMGIRIITGGKFLSGIKLKLPDRLTSSINAILQKNSSKAPLLIGLATATMPCGPLQAMQLYALSTGSFIKGLLAMAFYAAGTIPTMFAFGAFISTLPSVKIKNIVKISGLTIIILGLLTAGRGWSDSGLQRQVSKPINKAAGKKEVSAEQYFANSVPTDKYQTVEIEVTSSGFRPNVIKIKKGLPIRLIVKDGGATACTNEIIIYNGEQEIQQKIASPQSIIKFMPADASEIKFSSPTKTVWGKLIAE